MDGSLNSSESSITCFHMYVVRRLSISKITINWLIKQIQSPLRGCSHVFPSEVLETSLTSRQTRQAPSSVTGRRGDVAGDLEDL
jgi:hypothetical protein